MKTFYELTATKHLIDLELNLIDHKSKFDFVVVINNCEHKHEFNICKQLPLLDPILIEIKISGKDYNNDSESAIIVDKLTIDGFVIEPHLAVYTNDHNYTDPTNHLGFNGTWKVDINKPFYQWKHEVLNRGWLLSPTKY